ncbi:MAG: S8 family serine peptidase [Actinobacteria bacterium]|uniref:Unannotated protein n=1 Tax=freshwater metagenome TaxID=449393 RepID=A0A6J6PN46_9ZZZZ|nr:S8 family serine peptidase [Actinomycetota bacterium]
MKWRWPIGVVLIVALSVGCPTRAVRPVTVGYTAPENLAGLHVLQRIPALRIAVVDGRELGRRTPAGLHRLGTPVSRIRLGEPALNAPNGSVAPEWAYHATRSDTIPASALRSAAAITVAVVDTGADLSAPDIGAKSPTVHSVVADTLQPDLSGHGTFVASLAAGSITNDEGVAGFGGDAKLMIVQANRGTNAFTDIDEAAAIVWAVDQGAKIINLSIGGSQTSEAEREAVAYATARGVLLVAPAGNTGGIGDAPTYPAALLGTAGLVVGASTTTGTRASFSTTAPYVSVLAPGVKILGAVSASAPTSQFVRVKLTGSTVGQYAYGTGTSYAAPIAAGIAAVVWGTNPGLTAGQVVQIIQASASQRGTRTPEAGYGVVDAAGAVALALGQTPPKVTPNRLASVKPTLTTSTVVNLRNWSSTSTRTPTTSATAR